jgi:hypothetical protein
MTETNGRATKKTAKKTRKKVIKRVVKVREPVSNVAQDDAPEVDMSFSRPGVDEIELFVFAGMQKLEQKPVEVTVNGYKFTMQRSVWVRVPRAVLNVLMDAVVEKVVRIGSQGDITPGDLAGVWKEMPIPRFHFQYRDIPAEEPATV